MAGTSRRADFLHLHANVSRRVRNLETGVHPTASIGYQDTPPTNIPITNSDFGKYMELTAAPAGPQWQSRHGAITLLGGVEPRPNWAAVSTEETIGTLPAQARPLIDLLFNGAINAPPYVCQFRVQADGTLSVLKPAGVDTATRVGVRFEGANWTTD